MRFTRVQVCVVLLLAACSAIAGCVSKKEDKKDDDKQSKGIEIIYSSDCEWLEDKANSDMQSVLSRFNDIDLVYAHNDPMAHGAWVAAKNEQEGREKTIKFVGIDSLPNEGMQYVRDGVLTATLYYPTLGPEAIDAAVAILKGDPVPRKKILGTRLFTKENIEKGGEEIPAPAGANTGELTKAYKSDPDKGTAENPWIIGMSQCNLGEPWRDQMNKDIAAAAKKHPEIKVIFKDAQNETTTQQNQVREFIDQKVDLLIVSPKESKPLTGPVAEVYDAGIPVIVLDRALEGDKFTCFIGGDNRVIGEAAGRYIAKLLGGKGKIVELKGLMTSQPGVDRHEGFIKGLGDALIKE